MLKAWILSALGVGVIVTGVILAAADDSKGEPKPYVPRWRSLTDKEVRVCINTMRERDAILGRNAEDFVRSRQVVDATPQIRALALRHRLTLKEMKKIWDRVTEVVNIVRWQEERSRAKSDLEQQLAIKQDQALTTEKDKALQAQEIAMLEERIKGKDASDVDKALVKKYWTDLKIVPYNFGQSRPVRPPR